MTTIPESPRLIDGWYRHHFASYDTRGKGQRTHAVRTIPGVDGYVRTLCGQVWMKESLVLSDDPWVGGESYMEQTWFCHRCERAWHKWKAREQ